MNSYVEKARSHRAIAEEHCLGVIIAWEENRLGLYFSDEDELVTIEGSKIEQVDLATSVEFVASNWGVAEEDDTRYASTECDENIQLWLNLISSELRKAKQ